jgi:hypothetical protein
LGVAGGEGTKKDAYLRRLFLRDKPCLFGRVILSWSIFSWCGFDAVYPAALEIIDL